MKNQKLIKNSIPFNYLGYLDSIFFESLYLKKYKEICDNNKIENNIFLSIIVRTQGNRNNLLIENLESLKKQTCNDFEIIIVGHNLTVNNKKAIKEIIDNYKKWFNNKINFIDVRGGKRAKPINYGFAYAKGEYAICLDDDDIAYSNFVKDFKIVAAKNPNRIIHAYVYSQDWTIDENGQSKATSELRKTYCEDFNYEKEMIDNCCPINSLAIPTVYFKKYGIIYDEKLDVLEDYDYLIRLAAISGVSNTNSVVSLYKNWINNNSQSAVSKDIWDNNRKTINNKIRKISIYNDLCINNEKSNVYKYEKQASELKKKILSLEQDVKRLSEENYNIKNSTSWKITKPLRKVLDIIRKR